MFSSLRCQGMRAWPALGQAVSWALSHISATRIGVAVGQGTLPPSSCLMASSVISGPGRTHDSLLVQRFWVNRAAYSPRGGVGEKEPVSWPKEGWLLGAFLYLINDLQRCVFIVELTPRPLIVSSDLKWGLSDPISYETGR